MDQLKSKLFGVSSTLIDSLELNSSSMTKEEISETARAAAMCAIAGEELPTDRVWYSKETIERFAGQIDDLIKAVKSYEGRVPTNVQDAIDVVKDDVLYDLKDRCGN